MLLIALELLEKHRSPTVTCKLVIADLEEKYRT